MALTGIFVGAALGYLAARLLNGLTLLLVLVVVGIVVGGLLSAFVAKTPFPLWRAC
jgi:F0F1-type ATP synthase assembly protein I